MAVFLTACSDQVIEPDSSTRNGGSIQSETDYIEGVVSNESQVPEAGVWVIAETDDLATPFRKIVVTDENGRFVLPELPDVEYEVWVRGYGLEDAPRSAAVVGDQLQLTVTDAEKRACRRRDLSG